MREADDHVIAQSDVIVAFTDTAVGAEDIGQAIANGSLARGDIKSDLVEMFAQRQTEAETGRGSEMLAERISTFA